ncbi:MULTISPECIES: DLW-39 family protein [unclassified Nocardia]|nr:DLW-39 family protein [Nocardia sp. NBC_01329]
MKYVLTIGIVAAVLIGINKLRQRDDADLWHEVTTR